MRFFQNICSLLQGQRFGEATFLGEEYASNLPDRLELTVPTESLKSGDIVSIVVNLRVCEIEQYADGSGWSHLVGERI